VSQMIPDLVAAREELRAVADEVLARLAAGVGPNAVEVERVDVKEEAARRDRSGGLLPASPTNQAAAEHLAGEVRCMANTPRGGAIVLGVEDGTWAPLGTDLDIEWLRQRLDDLTGIAPVIEEREVGGARVLLLLIAESPDPVEDSDHRVRWRVGDRCVEADRAEWWTHRAARIGVDPMAAPTERSTADISDAALAAVRKYLEAGSEDPELVAGDADTLLTRLGVLRPTGTLSQAGVLVLTPSPTAQIELSRLDVAGGNVIGRFDQRAGTTLIEALAAVEERLDAYNEVRPENRGFVEAGQRQLPVRAVREAVLNHLIHRDWMQPEPTTVRWIDADASLEVTSPGGFTGGVTAENVLTTRHSRYPALADLFRALRLVDRQGVGVPRMYQTMLAEGHHVPLIESIAGPRIRTTLTGEPLRPVMAHLLGAVTPLPRRRDVRVAVLIDALLSRPALTAASAALVLQSSVPAARLALEAAQSCHVGGVPLLSRHGDAWLLTPGIANDVRKGRYGSLPTSTDLLWFRQGSADTVRRVAEEWLDEHPRVSSGDVATLTGMSQPNVSSTLSALAAAGDVIVRGPGKGRAAHFVSTARD